MGKLRVLDIFSGIGGFSLGLERTGGFETVAFCEIEPFCQKVLKKHWPEVVCYDDVRKLNTETNIGSVDVICGGYPCQPFSTAGKRLGAQDDRHLWPEVNRLLDEYRPTWFIGENVAGHVSMGLDNVLSDLEAKGYSSRPFIIPACAVDAKHRRDRVWILGYSEHNGSSSAKIGRGTSQASDDDTEGQEEARQSKGASGYAYNEDVANSGDEGSQRHAKHSGATKARQDKSVKNGYPAKSSSNGGVSRRNPWWSTEPKLGRVAYGVSRRVDRLKSLGNAVVPQIPELIGYAILEAEKQRIAA